MATVVQLQKIAPLGNLGEGLISFAKDFAAGRKEDRISGDISEAMEIYTTNAAGSVDKEELIENFAKFRASMFSIPGISPEMLSASMSSMEALHGASVNQMTDTANLAFVAAARDADMKGGSVNPDDFAGADPQLMTEWLNTLADNRREADEAATTAAAQVSTQKTQEQQIEASESAVDIATQTAEEASALHAGAMDLQRLEIDLAQDKVDALPTERDIRNRTLAVTEQNMELALKNADNAAELHKLKLRETNLAILKLQDNDKLMDRSTSAYKKRHGITTNKQAIAENEVLVSAQLSILNKYSSKVDGGIVVDETPGMEQQWIYATKIAEDMLRERVEKDGTILNPAQLAERAISKAVFDFKTGRILTPGVLTTLWRGVANLPKETVVFDVSGEFLNKGDTTEDTRTELLQPLIQDLKDNRGFSSEFDAQTYVEELLMDMKTRLAATGELNPAQFVKAMQEQQAKIAERIAQQAARNK
jgi:hypothetical protein